MKKILVIASVLFFCIGMNAQTEANKKYVKTLDPQLSQFIMLEFDYPAEAVEWNQEKVRILVLPADGFCEADRELLLSNIRLKIPDDMQVKIELVERLAPSSGGKVPYVVRLV